MKKQLLSTFIILFTLTSCHKNSIIQEQVKSISLSEVKAFFKSSSPHMVKGIERPVDINWEGGIFRDISIGDAMVFALKNCRGIYLSHSETNIRFPLETFGFAIAYHNKGSIHLELVQPVPVVGGSKFTGFFAISDWGKEIKRTLHYENGEYIGENLKSHNEDHLSCHTIHTYMCAKDASASERESKKCQLKDKTTHCLSNTHQEATIYSDYWAGGKYSQDKD